MRLPRRDLIATALVGAGALVYLLWAVDVAPPGLGSARAAGLVVLGLGFAASASAVVPTFVSLLHGDRAYLVGTSLLGAVAFAGGLWVLIAASAPGFAIMVGTTVALWLITTAHHLMLARPPALTCANCGRPVQRLHCDVCGYEIVERVRDKALRSRP